MPVLELMPPLGNICPAVDNINPHSEIMRTMLNLVDVCLVNDYVITYDNITTNELSDPDIKFKRPTYPSSCIGSI